MESLKEVLYEELKIKESFEIPTKLLEKMLGNEKEEFCEDSGQYFPEYAYTKHIYGY